MTVATATATAPSATTTPRLSSLLQPTPLLQPKLTLNIAPSSTTQFAGSNTPTSAAATEAARAAALVLAAVQRLNGIAAMRNAALKTVKDKAGSTMTNSTETPGTPIVEVGVVVNVGYEAVQRKRARTGGEERVVKRKRA
ncbi:hypothetical protein K461DRAFT_134740 [Myriangium duriaei CBS 260.36]|uniref:Uncharacterized protein n=1 Tax=Myriangium duriaei CBS 260.36 TaxID=1168546 RepID=A0A9P4MMU3_9PEZI|nr:hypothetical protein K461DRAFT_134740 [Myriangium duriaei CBS 260.36]